MNMHAPELREPNRTRTHAFLNRGQEFCAPPAATPVRALATAALIAWLTHPTTARAQAIDQYLNPDVPGYGTQPGVTVASRERADYEAPGVRLGNIVLTPVLSESGGYDDNVTGTADPRGSALIQTNATLGAKSEWSGTSLAAALMVDNLEYPQAQNQSYTNWSAALGGSHDFGRDTLYLGATHLNLNQTPLQLDVPLLSRPIAYRVDDVRASYKVDLGHITLTPGIDVSNYGFDNGTVQGEPYLQSYRNRLVFSPSLEAAYEFATRRRLVVVLRDTQADYDNSPPGSPRENFNDASVLAGLAYDVDGAIGFRLLAGYEERSFAAGVYKSIQAPIVESSLTWTPTELTTITGTAARYIEDSAAEGTAGLTETALKLKLDHEYLRNVILSVHGAVYLDDYARGYQTSGGSQAYFTGGLGAQRLISRNLRLAADYTFSARRSHDAVVAPSFDGSFFGGNYAENSFRLTLRFAL